MHCVWYFWPCNVVTRGICYDNVCTSISLCAVLFMAIIAGNNPQRGR